MTLLTNHTPKNYGLHILKSVNVATMTSDRKAHLVQLKELYGTHWVHEYETRFNPTANLVAGGFGGLCSLVVGFPFDTVKVRLQTSPGSAYRGGLDCLRKIVLNEGFLSLYRGMSGLVCVALPRFALMFHSNAVARNFLDSTQTLSPSVQIIWSGLMSQVIVVPLIVAPLERIKVLIQVDTAGQMKGQLDCVRQVYLSEGLTGFFRGTLVTYARDMPSFATYFFVYDIVRNHLFRDKDTGLVGPMGTLLAGAAAGIAGWAVAIPADVVKNRHQSMLGINKSQSALKTAALLFKEDGLKGFFRGAAPILLRAGPANAAAFLGYEAAISLWALIF